jgi:hypothetical protein
MAESIRVAFKNHDSTPLNEVQEVVLKKTVVVTVYSTAENVYECISDREIKKLILNSLNVAGARGAIRNMESGKGKFPVQDNGMLGDCQLVKRDSRCRVA